MFFGGFPGMPGGFPGGDDFPGMGGGKGRGKGKEVDTEGFYKLLEVEKTASGAEIKKAYRKLAIKHHPDKGGDPEQFKSITKAYEVLSDENKRKLYDQYGEEGVESGGGGGDPTDIFDMVFGGGRGRKGGNGGSQKKKGKDVTHAMDVTLEQMYVGYTKKLAVNRTVIDEKHGVKECDACDGRGVVVQVVRMGNMIQQIQQQCSKCNGMGKSYKTKKEKEVLEVYVERGAPDSHKVVFYNKADEQPGYDAGDVQFVLQEKEHPEFKRNKADLTIHRQITLLEALTGFSMELTHLDGRKLLIKSAPGEVLAPPKNESAEWLVFDDTDAAGTDVATCTYSDANKLKEVCLAKNFNGFVLDTATNKAIFRDLTRDEMLSKKKKKSGTKLFVIPDPEVAAGNRMRKCVKGEGMPVFKNPMMKGNLFIEFEIIFPKTISEDAAKTLRTLLPGPDPMQVPDEDADDHIETHFLTEADPQASEKEHASAYEEDDDDERRGSMGGGGGNVQCAQQ
ncbi:unnamed protein product [Amoebophrya sp. A25]|nr:unnamed protein product [Amoebophrya sp. A25]|eukprot:GSA25T00003625001.1